MIDRQNAFHCTNEVIAEAMDFVDSLEANSKNVSDLTGAVVQAIQLDQVSIL
jgi:hypothetical protein